ncbi:MAG: hypothetical protein PVG38_06625 [Gammaproteobacteria bacterium]|jgi:hypothetical protein
MNYGLTRVCTGTDDFGPRCETGRRRWLEITNPGQARYEAAAAGATGYCRPEDLHADGSFDGTGEVVYYHVQRGEQYDELRDFDSNKVDGRTDDLMRITVFKVKK